MAGLAPSLFSREGLRINVTAEEEALPAALSALDSALSVLPRRTSASVQLASTRAVGYESARGAEAYSISSQVGFAAAACAAARLGSPEFGHETVLAHLLGTGPLWEELRVKRGAYGASAWTDGLEGLASFSSYRDPRPVDSLKFFGEALEASAMRFGSGVANTAAGKAAEAEVEEAAIGSLGREQRPLQPEEKGFVDFRRSIYGIEDEKRQNKRDAMLSTSAKDIAAAAERLAAAYASAVPVLISKAEDAHYFQQGYPAARVRELSL